MKFAVETLHHTTAWGNLQLKEQLVRSECLKGKRPRDEISSWQSKNLLLDTPCFLLATGFGKFIIYSG